MRTPTFPPIGPFLGGFRDCPITLNVRPALPEVVGDAAGPIAIDLLMQCPQLLTARTAVVVIGPVGEPALPNVRAGLKLLVDGLASGGRSAVAFVDATAAPGPIAERSVDTERAAIDATIAGWTSRPADSAERWQANIRATIDHLLNLRPSRAPMLVVIDGAPPTGDATTAVDALSAGLRPLHDAVGLTFVFDLSAHGWLLDAARFGGGNAQSMLYSHDDDPGAKNVVNTMAAAMGMIGGPITQSVVDIQLPDALDVVPGSVRPGMQSSDWLLWRDAHEGRRLTLHIEAKLRAAARAPVGRHPLRLSVVTWRDGIAPSSQFSTIDVCVHVAGSTAPCVPTPTATPTAEPTRVPTAMRTAPPTRAADTATATARADGTRPAATTTPVATEDGPPVPIERARLWLPLAMRWR